jgi:hypothetical protein
MWSIIPAAAILLAQAQPDPAGRRPAAPSVRSNSTTSNDLNRQELNRLYGPPSYPPR